MRIDKINQMNQVYGAQTLQVPTTGVHKMGKDKVSFSEHGKDFQLAYKAAKDTAEIRNDKVQEIKERMNSGTYTVDAQQVSEKIMRSIDLKG